MYEGGLKSDELKVLLRFGNQAEQFNRGLDQMHQYIADSGKSIMVQAENSRIRIKALELVPHIVAAEKATEDEKNENYVSEITRYDAAISSIDSLATVGWFGWILRYLGRRK